MKLRKAFVMSVNAGAGQGYEQRHKPIWPELEKMLKEHRVSNDSIFLDPVTRTLFKLLSLTFLTLNNISRKWTVTIPNWPSALSHFAIEFEERMPNNQ